MLIFENIFCITFIIIEGGFLYANLFKFLHGGYVTVVIAGLLIFLMYIWIYGAIIRRRFKQYVNLLDFQVLAVLQYDDVKVTKGFIPYIAAGMDVAVSIVNKTTKVSTYKEDADGATYLTNTVTAKENESSSNIGFIVAAGLRYAFSNNAVIGFGVDYTHVFTNYDYSGIRVFLDAGYRF